MSIPCRFWYHKIQSRELCTTRRQPFLMAYNTGPNTKDVLLVQFAKNELENRQEWSKSTKCNGSLTPHPGCFSQLDIHTTNSVLINYDVDDVWHGSRNGSDWPMYVPLTHPRGKISSDGNFRLKIPPITHDCQRKIESHFSSDVTLYRPKQPPISDYMPRICKNIRY